MTEVSKLLDPKEWEKQNIYDCVNAVDEEMKYFTEIGAPIIEYYSSDLDALMERISQFLSSSKTEDLNVNELQRYFMELTSTLYLTTTNVEKVGLLMDLSSMSYKDAFNTSLLNYSNADGKNTVAKLNALSEKAAISNNVVSFIYTRTYKILKAKIDSASEMVRTLSKIISFKMNAVSTGMEDKYDVNTKRLLMEG